jgi:hypothetical protein
VAEANRDMHRNNLAVVNGQPVTNEELQAAADLRARVKKVKSSDVDALNEGRQRPRCTPSAQVGRPPRARFGFAPAEPTLTEDLNDIL